MYDEAFDICMNDMDSEEEWSSFDNKVTQVAPITDLFFFSPFWMAYISIACCTDSRFRANLLCACAC